MVNNIFFTGASGFIGSHFHQVLANNHIVNMDIAEPKFTHSAHYIKGDIRSKSDIESALSQYPCDTIISLAAEHKDFGISEEAYYETNEFGTQVMCNAATKLGIKKMIFYSSVAVYGGNKIPSTEATSPNPNLPYGASKLAGEKVLYKWADEDKERSVVIIRPAVVYGERNVANMFRLIEQIKAGRYFHIGEGKNVKSIAYVRNLVQATLFLKDNMQPGIEIYNYADTPQLSSREIASIISQSLSRKEPITLPYWAVHAMGIPFDIAIKLTGKDLPISTNRVKKFCTETYHKAEKILSIGFKPEFNNQEGLENMVKWLKSDNFKEEAIFDV
jgi:GlcNAc-P-P-Und epimerase